MAEAQAGGHLHLVDLPYRLCSWAFDDPANAALWEDSAGVARAWAVLQPPFWSFDYALDPAAPAGTLQALLAWADRRARAVTGTPFARPAWFISSPAGHPHNAEIEQAGFRSQADVGPDSWTKVLFQRSAAPAPAVRALPEGFQIRPLGGAAEVEAYVSLHRAVFQSENMTVGWRRRTLEHPAYRPELDLCWLMATAGWRGSASAGSPPKGRGGRQPARSSRWAYVRICAGKAWAGCCLTRA